MRHLAKPALALATLGLLLTSRRAEAAYDVLALPCDVDPLTCGVGAVSFSKTDTLPIDWHFDTGWVPQGSPLSVHIWADIWASTSVSLAGALQNAWPKPMTLSAPGRSEGANFRFHYGADFGAQAKIDVSVLGQHYSWLGDIPYVPQFDLEVQDERVFDAWGYTPGISISGATTPQTLATVSISDIVGSSIPGIDGGFMLDVAVGLNANYVTHRIVVDTTDGNPVAGGPITAPDGLSSTPYTNGSFLELDVHPEGTVHYDGVVHIIPTFYVSLLGKDWQIPVADIPISFPITDVDWVFDKQRVHFPLPDLALTDTELDFGDVLVGETVSLDYQMWNAGEAPVAAAMQSSDDALFPLLQGTAGIDAGNTAQGTVTFVPTDAGDFTGSITVLSNDPNAPTQLIKLKAKAHTTPEPTEPPPDGGTTPAVNEDGNCACRAAGESGSSGGVWVAALGVAALLRRRRR
jgi:MYXO-CTERM domain-containing protein